MIVLERAPALVPRRANFLGHTIHCRQLTLHGQRAVDFLAPLLYTSWKRGTKDRVTAEASTSKKSLAVLLHADRRGQTLSIGGGRKPVTFFGPSLIVCPYNIVDKVKPNPKFGQGDLGILQAQHCHPDRVFQVPLHPRQRRYVTNAIREDLLQHQMTVKGAPIKNHHHFKKQLTPLLFQLERLFYHLEMIWFTAQLSFGRMSVKIHQPFLEFDDFAVHRIKALKEVNESAKQERDSNTAQAEDGGLFYKKLLHHDGKVGLLGYGAGIAMATMDGLKMVGGSPANFLDGGREATKESAKLAIETLHRDANVTSIFDNVFGDGGSTRYSVVAEGIIQAVQDNDIRTPFTIRLMGAEAEEAKEVLRASKLPFTIEDDFKTATKLAVSVSQSAKTVGHKAGRRW